jgi:hypothetical protein
MRLILRDSPAHHTMSTAGFRFNEFILMVSFSNHELVAVRRAHREAMGNIVFQQERPVARGWSTIGFSVKIH